MYNGTVSQTGEGEGRVVALFACRTRLILLFASGGSSRAQGRFLARGGIFGVGLVCACCACCDSSLPRDLPSLFFTPFVVVCFVVCLLLLHYSCGGGVEEKEERVLARRRGG